MKLKTEFMTAGILAISLSSCTSMIKQPEIPEGPMEAQITMIAPDGQIITENKEVYNIDRCIDAGEKKVTQGFDVELTCADINTGTPIRTYSFSR